jgi:hypothetical protein
VKKNIKIIKQDIQERLLYERIKISQLSDEKITKCKYIVKEIEKKCDSDEAEDETCNSLKIQHRFCYPPMPWCRLPEFI